MKEFRNQIIILIIFFAVSCAISLNFYSEMQEAGVEKVPIHWNIKNEADNFASPLMAVIIGPLSLLLITLGACISAGKKIGHSEKQAAQTVWILVGALLTCVNWIALKAGSGYTEGKLLDASFLHLMIGLFMIIMGNLMPKIHPGYWIGIRVPKTLANEEVWNRVHRKAGRMMVAAGILIFGAGIFSAYNWAWIFYLPLLIVLLEIAFILPAIETHRVEQETKH